MASDRRRAEERIRSVRVSFAVSGASDDGAGVRARMIQGECPSDREGDAGDVLTLSDALLEARLSVSDVVDRPELAPLPAEAIESAAIEIRYAGYIDRQRREVERASRAERLEIPESLYSDPLREISREGREKLLRIRPRSVGHASRIPGFSPADVAVLVVYAERERRRHAGPAAP